MNNPSGSGLDLEDLELQFLPAWAQQAPEHNRFAQYEGGSDRPARGRSDGPRPRRDGGRPEVRRDRGPRPGGPGGPGGGGDRGPDRRRGFGDRDGRGRGPAPEAPRPMVLPDLEVVLLPEGKGVDSLARQIRLTGRAYPVFDIGQLILKRPERYHVKLSVIKKVDGSVAQGLWQCNIDESLWLAEQDAMDHVLRRHFDLFYQTERTPSEPPKGTYTFVAQCGMSGAILGPPNYHDYQAKLHKLHADRFSRMPFDMFKSRVRIVRDEAVVKKWIDDQSWKVEYVCLNVPEAKKLASMDEVRAHFREVHLANIVKVIESIELAGPVAQQQAERLIRELVRRAWDDQRRFPLRLVTVLSQMFASHNLHFFKVRKSITHVSVARPRFLDVEATPVSDGVRRIVDFIQSKPGCNRRMLVQALAPAPAAPVVSEPAPVAEQAAPASEPVADGAPTGASEPAPAADPAAARAAAPAVEQVTPEQQRLIADLHWLVHEGHVIEFSTGLLENARKPVPKPPKPERAPVVAAPSGSKTEAAPAATAPEEAAAGGVAEGEAALAPEVEGSVEEAGAGDAASVNDPPGGEGDASASVEGIPSEVEAGDSGPDEVDSREPSGPPTPAV